MSDTQSIETAPEAFGKGEASKAKRWINEIDLSERNMNAWLERCRQIVRKYKNERATSDALMANDRRRMAVLWSNIEVLKPAVYARPPQAVVLRRFKDADPLGRVSAEVLERALNYTIDFSDFDWTMKECRDENLICGAGVSWVRYVPTIEQAETTGQVTDDAVENPAEDAKPPAETLADEETVADHVNYSDFGYNKARTWSEVRFVWRRVFMTREALKKRFTKKGPDNKTIGELVPLDWQPEKNQQTADGGQNMEMFQKARIYEVWDLDTRCVYWVSKSYPNAVLDEVDDPLGLSGFFPCPRPLFATQGPDSVIPVPDYMFYQDQAEEIDDLTLRIGILQDSLRMVGFYAGESEVDLQNVFRTGNENKLIPIDSYAAFKDKGGVRGIIEWVPIDIVVAALTACVELRKELLDNVYQITGISDIMRGDTDPRETKGAQVLKMQNGAMRVRERQKEMARFARDNLRIMAEIIAEHFSWQTLKAMTNLDLFTAEEKQQVQAQMAMQAQQAQQMSAQTGQPAPVPQAPEAIQEKLNKPTWEEVEQFLRNDALRRFRIDVETDSTIEPNAAEAKQDVVEWVTAVGGFLQSSLPVVMAAPAMGELVGEVVKAASRRFNFGREMEDVIDRVMDKVGQQSGPMNQPQKSEGAAGANPQVEALKAQIEQLKIQAENQRTELAEQTKRMKIMSDEKIAGAKIEADKQKTEVEQANAWIEATTQRVHDSEMAQRDSMEADKDRQLSVTEAEREREHGGEQADKDRKIQAAAAKRRPN